MSIDVKSDYFLCYLQIDMKKAIQIIVILCFFLAFFSCARDKDSTPFSEIAKVALRYVGHHLLLTNHDSTSIVNPVKEIANNKYQISFEKDVSIHPDSLVNIIRTSFKKSNLPQFYLVEVKQCEDDEVAYSYEMKQNIEKGIVPCGDRVLKKGCYILSVRFTKISEVKESSSLIYYLLGFVLVLILVSFFFRRNKNINSEFGDDTFASIGRYKFYPDQNKLIKEAIEISLSKKECEILELLVAQSNQIVKREEITKKVWEDNGVVVGRSLDTYISKLRKKLKDDESIKLINVHGVGYKLEINN